MTNNGIVFSTTQLKPLIREINFTLAEWGLSPNFTGETVRRALENKIVWTYARCDQAEDFRAQLVEMFRMHVMFSKTNKSPVVDAEKGFRLIGNITEILYGKTMTEDQVSSMQVIIGEMVAAAVETPKPALLAAPAEPVPEPA